MIGAALLLVAAVPNSGPHSVDFKRAFKQGASETYSVSEGEYGAKEMTVCQYTETVTSVTATGAAAKFDVVRFETPGLGVFDPVAPLTSNLGFDNMPTAADIKSNSLFILFGSVAGIAPNRTVKVGDHVAVHWQNDSKDVKFDATGKLLNLDPVAKTITVDWIIEMTPSYTVGGTFKLTSIYAIEDLSLVKSMGTFTVGTTVVDIQVTRD